MKRILLVVAAGLALAGVGAHAAQPVDDEAVLKQLEHSWVKAGLAGDRAQLNQILDDSYVNIGPDGRRSSKLDMLSLPPADPGATQTVTDMEVRVNGDTAVVTGTNQSRESSAAAQQSNTFTDVFVRRDGQWRAIAGQLFPSSQRP